MQKWVEIPHGMFLVEIHDPLFWVAIRMEFLFRGMPWRESPAQVDGDGIPAVDFYMIASTCPCDDHMDELANAFAQEAIEQEADLPPQTP